MTEKEFRKKVLKRLENIEKRVDDLTRNLEDIAQAPDRRGIRGFARERPFNPWTEKSIRNAKSINIDPGILAKPETILPTLKALESNPEGLTADDVSRITERNRTTEANYLRKMYLLGIVDKCKSGKKAVYKLQALYLPAHIKDRI